MMKTYLSLALFTLTIFSQAALGKEVDSSSGDWKHILVCSKDGVEQRIGDARGWTNAPSDVISEVLADVTPSMLAAGYTNCSMRASDARSDAYWDSVQNRLAAENDDLDRSVSEEEYRGPSRGPETSSVYCDG